MLILWEAQFGDFANGAQTIIDQFIVNSHAKWKRSSGLVMLLPHGYEGQGPEHSNAYLERYLMACAEDNIQVCNLTTPAQYFHVLRRQVQRDFRRPLVIMAPKSLLRHKLAVSPLDALLEGSFKEILDDPMPPAEVRRLVLCSGKIYYDLLAARGEELGQEVALVRVEQFYPFCEGRMERIVELYRDAEEVIWVQEEPANRGGWSYIQPILERFFLDRLVQYVGRPASASPATGSLKIHRQEQAEIVRQALKTNNR
jgi:2-oxoglutarate dehydrogenase E1 component